MQLPKVAHMISLHDRQERFNHVASLWTPFVQIKKVEAYDGRKTGEGGIYGCYKSHLDIIGEYPVLSEQPPLFILEDDAIPCKDVTDRLKICMEQLPEDWNVFMLGYWPMQDHIIEPITKHISRAKKSVLATHCYMIHPKFVFEMYNILLNAKEKNLDYIFRHLQETHNVYIAHPSFSYQEGAWSDTGNCPTYYEPMKKYFKEYING